MGIFTSVIILILVLVIIAFMQLTPGTFALFYHYTLGKYSAKKTDDLSLSFILGAEAFSATMILITYFVIFTILVSQPLFIQNIFSWIMAGIFLGEAFAVFFCYFRKGKSTALFISRRIAHGTKSCISHVKSHRDAFILGATSSVAELIFTIPLYIIFTTELMKFSTNVRVIVATLFILATILPLFLIRGFYRAGNNLAEIQRLRVHLNPLVRIVISLGFIFLSLAIINCGIFYYG